MAEQTSVAEKEAERVEATANARESAEELKIQEELDKKAKRRKLALNVTPFLGLILITVFFTIVTNGMMLQGSNLANLVNQCFNIVIVSVGAAFVFAHGGMDMSVGAVMALSSMAAAGVIVSGSIPVWLALPAAILTGVVCGVVTSTIHVSLGVPVFVVSLCMKYICTGIVTTVVSKSDIFIDYAAFSVFNNGVIKAVVLIAVIAAGYFLFEYTSLGKNMKAIGGNRTMAGQSGVRTKRNVVFAFIIMGVGIGLVSFFSLTRVGVVTASTGLGFELDVMTAIVLGGFPLQGGAGSRIRSAVVGAVTVAVLTNGLTLWGADPSLIGGIQGILFLVIVFASYERKKGDAVA